MVFSCPVTDRFYNVFAHHRLLRGNLIATGRCIGISGSVHPVIIIRLTFLQTAVQIIGVIVHHIHDHSDALPVKSRNHFFHFPDTHFSMERVRRKRSLRYIVIQRIVSPVILPLLLCCLINTCKIIHRHDLHMRNTERFEIIQSSSFSLFVFGSLFC